MNDLDALKAIFDRAGVTYTVEPADACRSPFHEHQCVTNLVVRANPGAPPHRNHGYGTFFSVYSFNAEGGLICVGCWE